MDDRYVGFGLWQLAIIVVVLLLFVWPIVKILNRAGFSGWWVLLAFVPLGNLIGIWLFATARWPALERSPDARP